MAVNKVFLLGNLGADVVVRHLADGRPVANVNIATTEHWRDRENNRQKHTEWHRLVLFGRHAEIASEYLHKGSKVFVEGQLRTRKWEDKNGVNRETTEVRVLQFQMLDSRSGGTQREDEYGSSSSSSSSSSSGSGSGSSSGGVTQASGGSSGSDDGGALDGMEEDIPW